MAWQQLDLQQDYWIAPNDHLRATTVPIPVNVGGGSAWAGQQWAERVRQQLGSKVILVRWQWNPDYSLTAELVGPEHPDAARELPPGHIPAASPALTLALVVSALGVAGLAAFGYHATVREVLRWVPEPGTQGWDALTTATERTLWLLIMSIAALWGLVAVWPRRQ